MNARPATPRSRDLESEATRRSILDAAEALLASRGEEGLSIREVCLRAGVTPPTIYYHFGDKAALVDPRRDVAGDCRLLVTAGESDRSRPRRDDRPAHTSGAAPAPATKGKQSWQRVSPKRIRSCKETSPPGEWKATRPTSKSSARFRGISVARTTATARTRRSSRSAAITGSTVTG